MSRVDRTSSAKVRLVQGPDKKETHDDAPRDTRAALETLLHSARALSDDQAMNHILASVDQIPALEAEIKRRETQEEIAKSARQQALEDYAIQRDNWKAEKERFQKRIESLEKDLSNEKREIESLRAAQDQHSAQISSLRASLAKSNLDEESGQKQIQGLIKAIESERQKSAALNDDLKQSTTKAAQARTEVHEIQRACEKATKQADWYKREVDAAASLTVPIVDDAKVIDGMDAVWRKAATLICSTFYGKVNLGDSKTKAFWALYEQKSGLSDVLPLPQSNSEPAIQLRCVAILAFLARMFVRDLLQPTYLLPQDSNIRELVIRQAYDNPAKATAIRASLQALLPAAQDEAIDERTDQACSTVATLTSGLLPDQDDMHYRSQLKSLAEEVTQVWRAICCFTDTMEPRFDTRRHENWSGSKLVFEEKQCQIRSLGSPPMETGDEPIIAIFPRLYGIYEGFHDLETPGVFLMRTQAKAAQDELEKVPLSPRVGRVQSRQQRVRTRHGSAQSSTGHAMSADQSFLGPLSGHG